MSEMFAINFRRLYEISDKLIIRGLRNRRYERLNQNPGLDNRVKAFQEEGIKIEDNDVSEFMEQSESDFYQTGEAYNEHLNETLIGKYELRHHIVKERYFKENMPNLLTWSEKEQIRHLVNTSNEWTAERIAASFPTTVPVVKKLLKYPWKPATEQRIARHDASAMRNWKDLQDGSLDIPEELRQKFLKFTKRNIPPLNKTSIKVDVTNAEKMGEFERIIHNCAAKEYKHNDNEQSASHNDESALTITNETYVDKTKKNIKRFTLDEMTAEIKQRLKRGKDVCAPDKLMLQTVNTNIAAKAEEVSSGSVELYQEEIKDNTNNTMTEYKNKSDDNALKVIDYPERIRVPKKAYKRGATYKVNDCYYDHDGIFLYRVIGITN